MSSKLEPVIWSCDTGHIGIYGGVDVLTKPNLQMGYHIFLKGLGHAILGNFSTDRMVLELTKISK